MKGILESTNSKLNEEEFNNKNIVLKSRPRMIFLEFTMNCNLFCGMCRPKQIMSKDLFMSDFLLTKIEKELIPYVECIDMRGWGESTLDNRLIDFIKKYSGKKKLNLYTNLNSRNQEYWNELSKYCVNIILSIESGKADRYNLFRRGGNFKKLEENLSSLSDKKLLYFTTVVSDDNIDDLESIVDLAIKYKARFLQLNPISKQDPLSKTDYPIQGIKLTKYFFDILNKINKKAKDNSLEINLGANLNQVKISPNFDICIHPWSYCYIRFDGEIGFCDHLLCKKTAMVGNILNNDFMDVWNNNNYQKIRKIHIEKKLKQLADEGIECDWCYKNRYCNFEYLINKKYNPLPLEQYIKILKNTL